MIRHISYRRAEDFLFALGSKITKPNHKENSLYCTPNILLLCLNLYEICLLLNKQYSFLSSGTAEIIRNLTKIGQTFIADNTDEEKLKLIIFEKDFDFRDSLDLISHYNIAELMDNKNMEKISLEIWSSEYDIKGDIMNCSSALSIITWNTFDRPRDIVDDYMFLILKTEKNTIIIYSNLKFGRNQ